jgi:hypothetical protein
MNTCDRIIVGLCGVLLGLLVLVPQLMPTTRL